SCSTSSPRSSVSRSTGRRSGASWPRRSAIPRARTTPPPSADRTSWAPSRSSSSRSSSCSWSRSPSEDAQPLFRLDDHRTGVARHHDPHEGRQIEVSGGRKERGRNLAELGGRVEIDRQRLGCGTGACRGRGPSGSSRAVLSVPGHRGTLARETDLAAQVLPDREIHVINTGSTSTAYRADGNR